MQLTSFENTTSRIFKKSKAKKIFKCKLYYVYYGRNAWHSTWVTKYVEGSIHTGFDSARSFVEQRRVQGSVFYISEIPGIVYQSEKGYLIITEINTEQVLKGFNHLTLEDNISYGEPKIILKAVLNSKIEGIADAFDPFSEHWNERYRYLNSVLILYSIKKNVEFEKFSKRNNLRYSSYSIGVDYYYQYHQHKNKIDDKFIDSIIKESNRFDIEESNEFNFFQYLIQHKILILKSENIKNEYNDFYSKLNDIGFPQENIIWLKDEKKLFTPEDLIDINKILKKNNFTAEFKDHNLNNFISSPKPFVSILYPLNFLAEIIEDPYFNSSKLFEHLKIVLIKAKIRNKSKGNIIIGFYDNFLNSRLFIFPLKNEREELLFSIEEIPSLISDSFDEFGLSPDELYKNKIYVENGYEWKLKQDKSFVKLIYPKKIVKRKVCR